MPDQERIKQSMADIAESLLRKIQDAGHNSRACGLLSASVDERTKRLVRIDDKLGDLAGLLNSDALTDITGETVLDMLTDLIGDFVLLRILIEKENAETIPMSVAEAAGRTGAND